MRTIKNFGRALVARILGWQVRRLTKRHPVKTVGVVGSYGKTSAKFAIAGVLEQAFRVRFQAGNYNDFVSVPLIFFGETMPNLLNPFGWLRVFWRNERQIRGEYPYDVVVLELGTDGPGQINAFSKYLQLDAAVLTSIAYEHMEFFADLQAVAREELAVCNYSQQLIYNADLCAADYLAAVAEPLQSFGLNGHPDYKITDVQHTHLQYAFTLQHSKMDPLTVNYHGVSKFQAYSATAAAIVGLELGMERAAVVAGVNQLKAVSGRMQLLHGTHDSLIIDETYNASPDATIAALDVLYGLHAPHKIALLGNMNELGTYAAEAHTDVGRHCDPKQLDIVMTLGPEANEYLAAAAEKQGCTVVRFDSPFEAGVFLAEQLQSKSIVLVKGSQNGVFAEETIKSVLADPADSALLVRQSAAWLAKKQRAFLR